MGGERASKTRMRLAGEICAFCGRALGKTDRRGERLCASCEAARQPRRKVYMAFQRRQDWHCAFLEADAKTCLPCKVQFEDEEKLIELAKRGGGLPNLEADQMLRHGIEIGRGGVWLSLTEEQYQKLKKR